MIFTPLNLVANISREFADSLDAQFQKVEQKLILVSALSLNHGLLVCENYLKDAFEEMKAQGGDVVVTTRAKYGLQLSSGKLVLMEEVRCEDDVAWALALVNLGCKVIATIHGADEVAAINRLEKLAGQSVQEHVEVVCYQGQHKLVAV
jgi:hypothetical protein